ncbi:MAG: helicase C-terminal domain-containing protein [bacterium]
MTETSKNREQQAERLIAAHCLESLRALINEFNGCEVFAVGSVGDSGTIDELDPLAFGNWDAVPAPAQEARPGQALIRNHPSGELEPSDADINIASLYGKAGIGFYIIDNTCERVRVVVKPFRETKIHPVDVELIEQEFGPGGMLARSLDSYEHRPQQIEMMRLVARAFNDRRIAVVEAGTGVGKSFAYLAPAIVWALANRKRVVISTNTINLQEQLITKDIPVLAEKMGLKARAVLVKGRGNYVSLRRLAFAVREIDLIPTERTTELRQIAGWAARTSDGSRSDLPTRPSNEVWEAVSSDKDDCLRAQCPHFNECFFYKSRREAAAADIIVANHHLVMADLAIKREATGNDFTAILPPYDHVIFDEAHHIEGVATEYFSASTSQLAIMRQMQRLNSSREGKGILPRLENIIFDNDTAQAWPPTQPILKLLSEDAAAARQNLEAAADEGFRHLFDLTLEYFKISSLGPREHRELRITETVAESDYWQQARELLGRIADDIEAYLKPLERALRLTKDYPAGIQEAIMEICLGAAACAAKLTEHAASIRFFLAAGGDHCRWFEVGHYRDNPVIRPCAAPLDMAPLLRASLFERKKTVVLTSATLTVDKKFGFIVRQLGLGAMPAAQDGEGDRDNGGSEPSPPAAALDAGQADVPARCDFLLLGSPFDYQNRCVVGVPTDIELPAAENFEESVESAILDTISVTGGRAFVLFTSYKALERIHNSLRGPLAKAGITALRQGEMPRNRLLNVFRKSARAALFATSSFWEGVDVQGRALECLILTKLPFHVPTTPILEARTERIDRNGGNSFLELSVPLAVITFKQGFGRLIRSRADRGIVLILDRRLLTKHYGQTFLRSLPPMRVICGPAGTVIGELRRFYDNDK